MKVEITDKQRLDFLQKYCDMNSPHIRRDMWSGRVLSIDISATRDKKKTIREEIDRLIKEKNK